MAFSVTEVALEGFRISRARPSALLAWSGLQLAFGAVVNVAGVIMAGPAIYEVQQWQLHQLADPSHQPGPVELARLAGLMATILPAAALSLATTLIMGGILAAAVDRAVLRPGPAGAPGWIGLGAVELRQIGALAMIAGLMLLADVGFTIVATPLTLGLGAAGAALRLAGDILVMVALWSRLSLLLPATFELGRIDLGAAWVLARGRFRPLFLANLMAVGLAFGVALLVFVVYFAVLELLPAGPKHDDVRAALTIAGFRQPAVWVGLLFVAAVGGLTTPILLAPAASAYRQLKAEPAAA